MNADDYNRRFQKTPGSLPTTDQAPKQSSNEVVLPLDADPREERRLLDEAGYDYEGSEEWEQFMMGVGRL